MATTYGNFRSISGVETIAGPVTTRWVLIGNASNNNDTFTIRDAAGDTIAFVEVAAFRNVLLPGPMTWPAGIQNPLAGAGVGIPKLLAFVL